MPMMLQQTPKNFKDFSPIQFSEGTPSSDSSKGALQGSASVHRFCPVSTPGPL
jgi:hypothetical protein